MTSISKKFGLILLIAAYAIAFSNCSGVVTSEKGPEAAPPTNAGESISIAEAEEARKKNPNYRPLEKAIDGGDLRLLDGTSTRVVDKRGKVVLLNMWATWCGPCREEMPTLVAMQEKHRDKGFEVIGLNTDEETVEQINKFVEQMKLNYTIAWADTEYQANLLRISKFPGIPQSFIVDREGNLRGVFRGANPADVKKMAELVELIVNE